jgi:DNA-binding winged helix-turn-helix (wHTH) protein/TolB-like protein
VGGDRYRFGEFEFDPASGDLRAASADANGDGQRLAPQPAQLLELLAAGNGNLVTREEIREALWPGVQVDFDASLHFCVGQVRAALGDSAADPRYVQTLPRRGYRLIPPVERLAPPGTSSPPEPAASRSGNRRTVLRLGAALAIAIGLAGAWLLRGALAPTPPVITPVALAPIRVGILPFTPPASAADAFPGTPSIAEWVLQRLDERGGERLAIVGPTSTAAYADGPLQQLAADYDLAWLINGRFLTGESGPRMLGEVIRASDGAHVWVHAYTDLTDGRAVGEDIGDAALTVLGLEP